MQEVEALDTEIKRLKEIKTMQREFRRFVGLPSKPLLNRYSWSHGKTLSLLQTLDQEKASM